MVSLIHNSLWKQIRKVVYGTDSKSVEKVYVKQHCELAHQLPNQRVGGKPALWINGYQVWEDASREGWFDSITVYPIIL